MLLGREAPQKQQHVSRSRFPLDLYFGADAWLDGKRRFSFHFYFGAARGVLPEVDFCSTCTFDLTRGLMAK